MSGNRASAAMRIQKLVHAHCYGQALYLAANDMLEQCAVWKDTMSTSHEANTLIKYSPGREGIFRRMNEDICFTRTFILYVDVDTFDEIQ